MFLVNSLIKSRQLFSQKKSKNLFGEIIQFPLVRIIIAIIFLSIPVQTYNLFLDVIFPTFSETMSPFISNTLNVLLIILIFFSYKLYVKLFEQRKAYEISIKKSFNEIGIGVLIGGGLIILSVGILYLFGYYEVQGTNSPTILINRIFRYSLATVLEEFLFTLIVFRLFEEYIGSISALVLSSLFFGFAHFFNDNASVWSSMAIALSNPTILAPFVLTRRIWMPWALHSSWNYFQAGVFNMPNSGQVQGGFLQSTVNGPEWLTGGFFGIEASYFTVAITFIIGVLILLMAIRNGQWLKPRWMRN